MKTAQPASLPPSPRSSDGIRRSTAASIKAASSDVKNIQGPGRTRAGGFAAPGSHGMPPLRVRARPSAVLATSSAAVEASSERRDNLAEDRKSTVGISLFSSRNGVAKRTVTRSSTSISPCSPRPVVRFLSYLAWNIFDIIGHRHYCPVSYTHLRAHETDSYLV